MENKFFNSKLNSFLLLVLIILMILAFYFMLNDKEVNLPSIVDSEKTELVEDVKPKPKDSGNAISDILVVVDKSPMNQYSDYVNVGFTEFVFFATKGLNSKTNHNSYCGNGKNVLPCLIIFEKEPGKLSKIGEWPNQKLLLSYPDIFNNGEYHYVNGSMNFIEKNKISFKTEGYDNGCGFKNIQYWIIDLSTNEINLQKEEHPDAGSAC
jgi:hypothetical protein